MSAKTNSQLPFVPRFIRMRDAPAYLGMDKNRFAKEVRPKLTEINIGQQGIAFDSNELDAWADEIVAHARQNRIKNQEKTAWQRKQPASPNEMASGTSIRLSAEKDFMKALERATSRKRNAT